MGGGASAAAALPCASDGVPPNRSVCRVISASGSRSAGSSWESIIICIIEGAIPPAAPPGPQAAPPEDACPTFRHTYATMEALFDDIFIHIFKENSIAFPEYAEQQ